MSSTAKRRRVTAARKFPTNELFKQWLSELKDKASSYGNQAEHAYKKALRSIDKCPVELKSAEETKQLDGVGDKTVQILGGKLREFVSSYGEPTFDNIQLAGVEVDNTDLDAGNGGNDHATPPRAKPRRKSARRDYIPGYRTGGYAIIRALYDAYVEQDDVDGQASVPFLEKRELQEIAQKYCDESLKTATKDKLYTAWNSVNTLIKHDLIKMVRAKGSTMQYGLTNAGIQMGEQLNKAANDNGVSASTGSSSPSSPPPAGRKPKNRRSATKKKNGPASPLRSTSAEFRSGSSASPQRRFESNLLATPPGSSEQPFFASPRNGSPEKPAASYQDDPYDNDDYGNWNDDGFDYHVDPGNDYGAAWNNEPDPPPLAKRISDAPALENVHKERKSGYIYVDSDGFDTIFQDKAYCNIDTSLWYLIKTTNVYVQQVGRERFRECEDLPASLSGKISRDGEYILRYLESDYADPTAPGIFEENADELETGSINGHATSTAPVEPDYDPLPMLAWNDGAVEKPTTSTLSKRVIAGDGDSMPSTSRVRSPSKPLLSPKMTPPSISSSQETTSQPSTSTFRSSQTATRDTIVLEPGQFEIILVVDYAEVTGGIAMFGEKTKNRKAFLTEGLNELAIQHVTRRLPVGDYLFVARPKSVGGMNSDRELVLGPIIERKRMDDLASSIKDGRFHEQKLRLHGCGVHKVIYLIEDFGRSMDKFGMRESALRSAIVGTQICDGFDVIRKRNSQEVTTYLHYLLQYLRDEFGNKRLVSRQPDSLSVQKLIELESDEIALPTFREYADLSVKRRPLTVGDIMARALLQVPKVSADGAEAIRKAYPTLAHLMDAYERCEGDESRENAMLETIQYGRLNRNLGSEVSKRIARFFCALLPFTK